MQTFLLENSNIFGKTRTKLETLIVSEIHKQYFEKMKILRKHKYFEFFYFLETNIIFDFQHFTKT